MKRSERFHHEARMQAASSLLFALVAIACGAGASATSNGGQGVACTLFFLGALVAVAVSLLHVYESIRYRSLSRMERRWEVEREIRPKF
jgi:tRNA(Ile2) C34 agmatinyltransferase TiaS